MHPTGHVIRTSSFLWWTMARWPLQIVRVPVLWRNKKARRLLQTWISCRIWCVLGVREMSMDSVCRYASALCSTWRRCLSFLTVFSHEQISQFLTCTCRYGLEGRLIIYALANITRCSPSLFFFYLWCLWSCVAAPLNITFHVSLLYLTFYSTSSYSKNVHCSTHVMYTFYCNGHLTFLHWVALHISHIADYWSELDDLAKEGGRGITSSWM